MTCYRTGGKVNLPSTDAMAFVHRSSRWIVTTDIDWSGEGSPQAVADNLKWQREVQNHFTAGDGTPSFKEAEVPRGDVSFASQVELTEAAAQSPVAKQIADGLYRGHAI